MGKGARASRTGPGLPAKSLGPVTKTYTVPKALDSDKVFVPGAWADAYSSEVHEAFKKTTLGSRAWEAKRAAEQAAYEKAKVVAEMEEWRRMGRAGLVPPPGSLIPWTTPKMPFFPPMPGVEIEDPWADLSTARKSARVKGAIKTGYVRLVADSGTAVTIHASEIPDLVKSLVDQLRAAGASEESIAGWLKPKPAKKAA